MFNIPAVAGLYSQLAGTVAGLSFAALVYILTVNYDKPPNQEKRDDLERIAATFFMASVSLGICSLIFGSLAGHEISGARRLHSTVRINLLYLRGHGVIIRGGFAARFRRISFSCPMGPVDWIPCRARRLRDIPCGCRGGPGDETTGSARLRARSSGFNILLLLNLIYDHLLNSFRAAATRQSGGIRNLCGGIPVFRNSGLGGFLRRHIWPEQSISGADRCIASRLSRTLYYFGYFRQIRDTHADLTTQDGRAAQCCPTWCTTTPAATSTTRASTFFNRPVNPGEANSIYFSTGREAGGKVFNYAEPEVREFLIGNARMFLDEYHMDGFRFDQVTVIDHNGGWYFCQDLTNTLHYHKPSAALIAEYWGEHRWKAVSPPLDNAGMGFDLGYADSLRDSVREVLRQAAGGGDASVDIGRLRAGLHRPANVSQAWQVYNCIENHDLLLDLDGDHRYPRIPQLAHWDNTRSWLARSRSRVATGVLLTTPGVPVLFMGQEFLEDKWWSDDPRRADRFIWWAGLQGGDRHLSDFHRFTRDLIWLRQPRWRRCRWRADTRHGPVGAHHDSREQHRHLRPRPRRLTRDSSGKLGLRAGCQSS